MKKILNITSVLAIFTLFLAGCSSNISEDAYIYVSTESVARTVMPSTDYDGTDFVYELWGKNLTGLTETEYNTVDAVKLGTWKSYADLTSSKRKMIKISTGLWQFDFNAFDDNDLILAKSTTVNVVKGTNALTFDLQEISGEGSFEYKLTYPTPYETGYSLNVKLINMADSDPATNVIDEKSYTSVNYAIRKVDNKYSCLVYSNNKIASGYYLLQVDFVISATTYNTYTTVIKVSNGLKSVGEDTLTKNNYSWIQPKLEYDVNSNRLYYNVPGSYVYIYTYITKIDAGSAEDFDTALFTSAPDTTGSTTYSISYKLDYYQYFAIKYESNASSPFSNVIKVEKPLNVEDYLTKSGYINKGIYIIKDGSSDSLSDYETASWTNNYKGVFYKFTVPANTSCFISSVDSYNRNAINSAETIPSTFKDCRFIIYKASDCKKIMEDDTLIDREFTAVTDVVPGDYYLVIEEYNVKYAAGAGAFRIYK